jgi:hypothetical protein
MIISHRNKFAFFANPKTGSKAAGIMLRMAGIFDENDILIKQRFAGTRTADLCLPAYNADGVPDHVTPEGAIERGFITLEQLKEYNCFTFLRDPENRYYASRVAMMMNRWGEISNGLPLEKPHRPQYEYFLVDGEQVVTPLDFGDYNTGIKHMYDVLNAKFKHMDLVQIDQYRDLYIRGYVHKKYKYDPRDHRVDNKLYREMVVRNENKNS